MKRVKVVLQCCIFFHETYRWTFCLETNVLYFSVALTYLHFSWYHKQRLILSNGTEVNREPNPDSSQNFTICGGD